MKRVRLNLLTLVNSPGTVSADIQRECLLSKLMEALDAVDAAMKISSSERLVDLRDCIITAFKHKILLQLRSDILETFGIKEKNKPEKETPRKKTEKTKVKTSPSESKGQRLAILEDGIKRVIKILKKLPMLKRFKSLKRPLNIFIAAMEKSKQYQTESERIVQLEAAIGEGLSCLQETKMSLRSNVLKEIKKTLEKIIDNKNQISK